MTIGNKIKKGQKKTVAAGRLEIEKRRHSSGWMVRDDADDADDDDDGAEHGRGANCLARGQLVLAAKSRTSNSSEGSEQ